MSKAVISPFRLLSSKLLDEFRLCERYSFLSTGPNPCATMVSPTQYSLGTDSDWSAEIHDLTVQCDFAVTDDLKEVFGPGGIAAKNATLLVALEWTSHDSAHREIGCPVPLSLANWPIPSNRLKLTVSLPAGTVRGIGTISVQLFLGNCGASNEVEPGMARNPGFRFGALGASVKIVIDADGSLFPILEQSCGTRAALWEFRENWSDPLEEEFCSAYVSLVINTDHVAYPLLHDRRGSSVKITPLFTQVLASWVAVLVTEVMGRVGRDFSGMVVGDNSVAELGSIAQTTADLVRSGDLDTSSLAALISSSQRWIDSVTNAVEVPE